MNRATRKYRVYFYLLLFFILGTHISRANQDINVKLNLLDETRAEILITYPVEASDSQLSVLSTKKNGYLLDGHRELISAIAQDGKTRQINNNGEDSDATIVLQPNDTFIILKYRLTNAFVKSDISFFNFPIIAKTSISSNVNYNVNWPSGYELITDSGADANIPAQSPHIFNENLTPYSNNFNISNFRAIFHKKGGDSVVSSYKNFVYTNSKYTLSNLPKAIDNIQFFNDMFLKIFGKSIQSNIYILSVPLTHTTEYYEAEGIALPPNIILVDSNTTQDGALGLSTANDTRLLIHELAHLIVDNSVFSSRNYNARWFDEGMATFAEEYASDNYLSNIKDESGTPISLLIQPIKSSVADITTEYDHPFDYNFKINTATQHIKSTYSHSGLIFYNLFNIDNSIPQKLIQRLTSLSSENDCETCDTDKIINILQELSGLNRDSITYPYKGNINNIPLILLLSNTERKQREDILQSKIKTDVHRYLTPDSKVTNFEIPKSTTQESSSTNPSQKEIQKNKVQNISTSTVNNQTETETKKHNFIWWNPFTWFNY